MVLKEVMMDTSLRGVSNDSRTIIGDCHSPCFNLCRICEGLAFAETFKLGYNSYVLYIAAILLVGLNNVGIFYWGILRRVLLLATPGVILISSIGQFALPSAYPEKRTFVNVTLDICQCELPPTFSEAFVSAMKTLTYEFLVETAAANGLILFVALCVLYSLPGSCLNMPYLTDIFRLWWYGSDIRYIRLATGRARGRAMAEMIVRLLMLGTFAAFIWIVYPFAALRWIVWKPFDSFRRLHKRLTARQPDYIDQNNVSCRMKRQHLRQTLGPCVDLQHVHNVGKYHNRKALVMLLASCDLADLSLTSYLRTLPIGFWPFRSDEFGLLWRVIIVKKSMLSTRYPPSRFVRLNVCGAPEAGKTTLKQNLCMGWFRSFFTRNSTSDYKPTRAISMGVFSPNSSGDYFRVFDMAGQEEYMPSHIFSLGKPHSAYLLLVNALDSKKKRLADAKHWMSGISSCHNRSRHPRPPLMMIVSRGDLALPGLEREVYDLWRQLSSDKEFGDFFKFVGHPVIMDCRKVGSSQVKRVKAYLSEILSTIVQTMPDEGVASSILRYHLKDINRSLRKNIATTGQFLRHAARVIYGEKSMPCFSPLVKTLFRRAMYNLEQSGELVMFRVDTKTYVASDVEWLLSLVNGRIFCPDELAKPGDPPHLHCALNGCTTVADFQACFRDTHNEALLLELFQKIEICYRTGHHLRELVFPSLIRACDDLDCWPAAEGYENIATCLRCRNPEQFSAGFFPKLQVRLHTMWKVRYGMSDVPLFAGGVKVTLHRGVSPVEALIVLARGSFDTHIVVRAKLDHRKRAKRLHQLLIEVVKDTARDISQGTEFVEKSLTHHDIALPIDQSWSQPHFDIEELREACRDNRCAIDDDGKTILSLEEVTRVVLPALSDPEYLYRNPNGNFLATNMLDEDITSTIQQLFPATKWRQLAECLHLTAAQITEIQLHWKRDPIHNSPVRGTVEMWVENVNDCYMVLLRNALRDLGYPGCAGFVQRQWEDPAA